MSKEEIMSKITSIPAHIFCKLGSIKYKFEISKESESIYPSCDKDLKDSSPEKFRLNYEFKLKMDLPSGYLISKNKNFSRNIKAEILKVLSHRFIQKYPGTLSRYKKDYLDQMDIGQDVFKAHISLHICKRKNSPTSTRLNIKLVPVDAFLSFVKEIDIEKLIVSAIFGYIDADWASVKLTA